jgi:ketosteroid isomerase-like protein
MQRRAAGPVETFGLLWRPTGMDTFIIGKYFVICGTAKNQRDTMAKKQAFKNSNVAYAKAFNAGQPAKVAALYSKDAIFMMPETPIYKGTNGVLAQTQVAIDAGWRDIKLKTIKSGSDGDLAFNIGTVAMSQPSGDGRVNVKGKYLDVYRRQKDGGWKIIATMYNTDEPTKSS